MSWYDPLDQYSMEILPENYMFSMKNTPNVVVYDVTAIWVDWKMIKG